MVVEQYGSERQAVRKRAPDSEIKCDFGKSLSPYLCSKRTLDNIIHIFEGVSVHDVNMVIGRYGDFMLEGGYHVVGTDLRDFITLYRAEVCHSRSTDGPGTRKTIRQTT